MGTLGTMQTSQVSTIAGPGLPGPGEPDPASRAPHVEPIARLGETRGLFWQNVVREMLMTFPLLASRKPEVTDGRLALLTRGGERVPIAGVEALFPCSIAAPAEQALCIAVQATVFNVRTPTGEIFTVPLEEVRAVHTLSDELMKALESEARGNAPSGGQGEDAEPFGFAAYSSLRRSSAGDQQPAAHEPAI